MTTGSKPGGQDGDRLDSWKAIAAFIGKDVRTALRWAKDGGMPVYRHKGSKRGAVYAYRSEIDAWIHADRPDSTETGKNLLARWAVVLLFIALVTAGTSYWLHQVSDNPGLVAANPAWVLIADFDNRTGEERFDGTLETALRRELANSRQVLVVAPERIRETLVLMQLEPDARIDAYVGREISLRLGSVRALLTGQVEKFDTRYLLSLEVVDPSDGRMVASAEEHANGEAEVLPALHKLGNWVRRNLGEKLTQIDQGNEQLEKVTTPSLRALELYSKGFRFLQGRGGDAEGLFREAVQADPGFASAHLYVFWALYYQGKSASDEARGFLEQAMELRHTTSDQERLFIEGTYYDFRDQDNEKACISYKTLAELFPDHFFAAGNSTMVCGVRLGNREEFVRYATRTADQRPDWNSLAAMALALLERDFDQARPYYERALDRSLDQHDILESQSVAFIELFPAEEFLHLGMLPEVASELRRVELILDSVDTRFRGPVIRKLTLFYLSLGQFRKALELGAHWHPGVVPAWWAYLESDQSAFELFIETAYQEGLKNISDPGNLPARQLRENTHLWIPALPLEVLAPLYDPESAVDAAWNSGDPHPPQFLTWPKFEAKLKLVQGKQQLDEGRMEEAVINLREGMRWFRQNGGWETFPHFFLGAELLAVALAETGDLRAAYNVLDMAAGQRALVNSYTAPQHQKIQARLALLARKLGRFEEARALEANLAAALRLADEDHPILLQINQQGGIFQE